MVRCAGGRGVVGAVRYRGVRGGKCVVPLVKIVFGGGGWSAECGLTLSCFDIGDYEGRTCFTLGLRTRSD